MLDLTRINKSLHTPVHLRLATRRWCRRWLGVHWLALTADIDTGVVLLSRDEDAEVEEEQPQHVELDTLAA